MIFVTVGTSSWDFLRLIREMDRIAGQSNEDVIMQIGHMKYVPKNAKYFGFASNDKIESLYSTSRIIVSHAGVGSIISALRHSKPLIIVPRMKKYHEHVDDHQCEIAKELENNGKIKVVWDVDKLEKLLKMPDISISYKKTESILCKLLREYIMNLMKD